MLVASERHTDADITAWARLERHDRTAGARPALRRKVEQAVAHIRAFAASGPCYAGVSWGKDSTALAHIIATAAPEIPVVWVRWQPMENPDSLLVRDAFLARHALRYEEIVCSWHRDERSAWAPCTPRDTTEAGFDQAAERHGDRHISGVRARESASRMMRCRRWGVSTARTLAPLAWWTGEDVFAYLAANDLPVHPAYACSYGGALDRTRIRVDCLIGETGTGHGRREWEWCYYRRELLALGEDLRVRSLL